MDVAGTINPKGGAPKPDPARVAAIRYTIVDEPETASRPGAPTGRIRSVWRAGNRRRFDPTASA